MVSYLVLVQTMDSLHQLQVRLRSLCGISSMSWRRVLCMNSDTRCSLPLMRKLSGNTRLMWCRLCTTSSSLAAVRLTCTNGAGCWQRLQPGAGARSVLSTKQTVRVGQTHPPFILGLFELCHSHKRSSKLDSGGPARRCLPRQS